MEDVSGKRIIGTRLLRDITIREENATAALEVMSRFAADPKWLIYLPPTMAPAGTSDSPGLLEHPTQAFAYYRHEGVPRVICEEKHMGSRVVVVVCRHEDAARRRFGIIDGDFGLCYTRTGRRFFDSAEMQHEVLSRVRAAVEGAGLFEELDTDWLCLDCELMPWSAKAQELLTSQYAAVGAAANLALPEVIDALGRAESAGADVQDLLRRAQERAQLAKLYVDSYRHYCWPVASVDDLTLAPFHLLESDRGVHADKDHGWHLALLSRLSDGDPILLATPYLIVDLADPNSEADGARWWEQLTERGGEGMVVKPLEFLARGRRGLVQPALKCRGREYLRIIYGPEYTMPENLSRLRSRGLSVKRSLALREFALGIEGLERFVRKEPLRRIHECVFAVLALESEPVDPRL
jgi:protein phosphatase